MVPKKYLVMIKNNFRKFMVMRYLFSDIHQQKPAKVIFYYYFVFFLICCIRGNSSVVYLIGVQ